MRCKAVFLTVIMAATAVSILPVAADDLAVCRSGADGSIPACTRLLNSAPAKGQATARAYYNRANAFAAGGDLSRAIADFDQSISLDPSFALSFNDRGYSHMVMGNLDRAIADFDEAIRLDPNLPNARAHRGTAYLGKRQYDRAIADLNEALQLNPKYAHGHSLRGDYYLKREDYANAIADYETALKINPRLVSASNGLRQATAAAAAAGSPPPPNASTAAATTSPVEKRVALVIGNSAYPGGARLTNPANDADDVTVALRAVGFDVVEGKDLPLSGFSDIIDTFRAKAKGASVALFYYAGHGMQFEEQNWLMPINSRISSAFDARRSNVPLQEILSDMEANAGTNLVFLDACRDNPLADKLNEQLRSQGRGYGTGRGLGRIDIRTPQTLIVYATRPNMTAADGSERNSPFTGAFLQHVASPGVEVESLMKRVAASVSAKTQGRQQPERLSRLEKEFYFVPAK